VEDLLAKLARELFLWLNTFARQHDKYTEKIKITNLTFFRLSVSRFDVPVLQSFITSAAQQVDEATVAYVNWMVEYEFPSLSALATRMDGVGNRVADEELSVYIRRKDVLNVIKELEHKTMGAVVTNLRKRLEKHYKSEFDGVRGSSRFGCFGCTFTLILFSLGMSSRGHVMVEAERPDDRHFDET
jgi:hypothetical protein